MRKPFLAVKRPFFILKWGEKAFKPFHVDEVKIFHSQALAYGFDKAFIQPWLALENCFKQLGREIKFDLEAWTLELGTGMQMNPVSVEKGFRGVKNYLAQKGVLRISGFPIKETISHEMNFTLRSHAKKYYAPTGGMIQARVELGSLVKAGQRLYQVLNFNKEGKLPTVIDVSAEEDGLVYDLCSNQAVNEGEFVLGIIR